MNTLESTLSDNCRTPHPRLPDCHAEPVEASLLSLARVLQELGWDIYDPTAVWPECQTGESREVRFFWNRWPGSFRGGGQGCAWERLVRKW